MSRVRFVFDLSVEFGCLFVVPDLWGRHERQWQGVLLGSRVHSPSSPGVRLQSPGSEHSLQDTNGKLLLVLDAAGISSPAAGQGQVQAKGDVMWQGM